MPNWCLTNYKVVGPKEDISRFSTMLNELQSLPESRVENGFGKLWLGNLVDYLGGNWHDVWCRGEINDWDVDASGEMITMQVMSAWSEPSATRFFLKEKFPSCDIWFISEEPGNCYYVKNDTEGDYFPEKYILEYSTDDGTFDTEYFEDIRDIPPFLKEHLGVKCKEDPADISGKLKNWSSKDPSGSRFAYLNEFTLVD